MKFENYMSLDFPSKSCNEAFARSAVACFASQMDPTLEELGDIRTAVSEAVTNCIVHAYPEGLGTISIRCRILKDNMFDIVIKDKGVGIADIEHAALHVDNGFTHPAKRIRIVDITQNVHATVRATVPVAVAVVDLRMGIQNLLAVSADFLIGFRLVAAGCDAGSIRQFQHSIVKFRRIRYHLVHAVLQID